MQSPPLGVLPSSYAMGWDVSNLHGTQTIEHNGVLSTFYADAVLLPESRYGFVLLYNAYALSAATLAFPEIKNGVAALLVGRAPVSGKVTMPWLGGSLAALSALIAGLTIWSLRRSSPWKARSSTRARWKVWWSLLWPMCPALLLLGLPRLLAFQTGRYFEPVMLARAMPELIILLTI